MESVWLEENYTGFCGWHVRRLSLDRGEVNVLHPDETANRSSGR